MSLWVTHTQQMANIKRRRLAVTMALREAHVVITDKLVRDAGAWGDHWKIPYRDGVHLFLSIRGMEKVARHLNIELPRD